LRYYEFVSLNTDQIQKLKKRADALEAKNAELEERLAKLEALLINNAK
jgi:cell division protein FtsB